MPSHIKARANQLPTEMRLALAEARRNRSWSQTELGLRVGLPQTHVSQIETGRVVPRFDTLLDIVRVLGFDLLLVPREFVPAVHALYAQPQEDEQPLYEPDEAEDESP